MSNITTIFKASYYLRNDTEETILAMLTDLIIHVRSLDKYLIGELNIEITLKE